MSVALVVLIALVLIVPLVARRAQKRWDIFEPYVFFAGAYGVLFVLRPFYMISDNAYTYVTPLAVTNVREGFDRMLAVALVGAVAFALAYFFPSRVGATARVGRPLALDFTRATRAATILAAVGAASLFTVLVHAQGWRGFALVFGGRTSELSRAISDASFYPWEATLMLVPAGLLFLVLAHERRQKRLWVAFLLVVFFVALRALPEGDRAVLLLFGGGTLVLLYLLRMARPSLLVVGVCLVSAVYVSAFLSDLRGRSTRGQTVTQTLRHIASDPGRAWTRVASGPDTEMAPVLAAALEVIPSKRPYTYGATTAGDLVLRPIPRALWHSKPATPRVQLISTLWPRDARRHTINPEFSVLLYPYWDFGIIGVAVALGALGAAARLLHVYSSSLTQHAAGRVLFSLSLWMLVIGVRDTPVETAVRGLFVLGPVLLVMRLAMRERPPVKPSELANSSIAIENGTDDAEIARSR